MLDSRKCHQCGEDIEIGQDSARMKNPAIGEIGYIYFHQRGRGDCYLAISPRHHRQITESRGNRELSVHLGAATQVRNRLELNLHSFPYLACARQNTRFIGALSSECPIDSEIVFEANLCSCREVRRSHLDLKPQA